MNSAQKSWILLAVLSLTLMSIGFWLGERQGLLAGFILSLLLNGFAYFYPEYRWLARYEKIQLQGQDPWGLNAVARELAATFRVAPPKIFILPTASPTAFALGRNRVTPMIFLTRGLVEKFSLEELRAVLALEMAQVQRLDTLAFGVASALADLILFPALALDWLAQLGKADGPSHPLAPQLFRKLAAPLAFLPIFLIVGRRTYFDVDRRAAQALRDPEPVARVLWKMDSYLKARPLLQPTELAGAHMHIVNPLTSREASPYFDRHPPIQRRIVQLIGRYPI